MTKIRPTPYTKDTDFVVWSVQKNLPNGSKKMSNNGQTIRDQIGDNDVTMMRSYLEVDVAEWFSRNEIPFAYEAFTIPSVVGPGKDTWDNVVDAIQKVGEGGRESIELPDGTEFDTADILAMWNEIYDKHALQDEAVSVPVMQSLSKFSKRIMLPDFALYKDTELTQANEGFEWGDYDYIVEVSGLYGVGLTDEADESEWWDWYRVSGVAFKEFMYRLLGLWDSVRWVIPNQGSHDSTSRGIPSAMRNDEHYVIMDTTQSGIELQGLATSIGIDAEALDGGLSPAITPTKYKRPLTSSGEYERNQITPVKYSYDGINPDNIADNKNAVLLENDVILFHGDIGEVYITEEDVRVRESQWRGGNMLLLREYVLSSLSELEDDGIVEGLQEA